MPLMARTGSGARKARSVPGSTAVSPRGFSRSLAILATVLLQPRPMEHVTPILETRRAIRCAMARGLSALKRPGVMSKNASSIETCSTNGVSSARIAITCELTARYRSKWPGVQIACGQRRLAWAEDIAERTPNTRASYEAVETTPRLSGDPPTMTGLPRHADGPAARRWQKKASRSKSPIEGPRQAPKRPSSKPYVCSHVSMR